MATPIPENRASFEWPLIVEASRGRASGAAPARVTGVTSDSRRVRPGNLFVALPGERFDGHDFIPQAVEAGAAGVLVEKSWQVRNVGDSETEMLRPVVLITAPNV